MPGSCMSKAESYSFSKSNSFPGLTFEPHKYARLTLGPWRAIIFPFREFARYGRARRDCGGMGGKNWKA
jgi:hypothetical protein